MQRKKLSELFLKMNIIIVELSDFPRHEFYFFQILLIVVITKQIGMKMKAVQSWFVEEC